MRYRRSGIIIRTPRIPPQSARRRVRVQSISNPMSTRAGRVKATPAAIDSPADPVVCTTVFSRIEARPPSTCENARKRVIEMTAIGTEAETVRPTLRARYTEEAPKTRPSREPIARARRVSSGRRASSGTKGLKAGRAAGAGRSRAWATSPPGAREGPPARTASADPPPRAKVAPHSSNRIAGPGAPWCNRHGMRRPFWSARRARLASAEPGFTPVDTELDDLPARGRGSRDRRGFCAPAAGRV